MELEQIILEVRRRADDEVGPHLISTQAIIGWTNEAEREACLRADLLFDDSTPDVTDIAVAAGESQFALHPKVQRIVSATFNRDDGGRPKPLDLRGLDWIEERSWHPAHNTGRPDVIAHDGRNTLHLWPRPGVAGTLRLSVYRLPLIDMEDPSDEPEIAEHLHEGLIDWIMHRAFGVKDSENYDPQRSEAALAKFEERFGIRNTARVLRQRNERRRVTTRYGGL